MSFKVGIPQALLYYNYYPAWKTFFQELGGQVIVSHDTTKEILDQGLRNAVDEACLPVKLFYGHVINLKDKVDYLFIPRIVSIEKKAYICPKFLGLPDMIRHGIKDLPPIIDTIIDLRNSSGQLLEAAYQIGKFLGAHPWKILLAFRKAAKELRCYDKLLAEGYLPSDALEIMEKKRPKKLKDKKKLTILLLGHPYNVYDPYISMNLLEKMEKMGVQAITPEMLNQRLLQKYWGKLSKNMFWSFGRKNWGASTHFLENKGVDGMIYLAAFGCGPDSLLGEIIERQVRRRENMPFMLLNIDEHTGEAGVVTRLEAFIDMIKWREAQ